MKPSNIVLGIVRARADQTSVRCVKGVYNGSAVHASRRYIRYEDGSHTSLARVLVAVKIGRRVKGNEIAHHVNGDPGDDRLENLVAVTPVEHSRIHREMRMDAA